MWSHIYQFLQDNCRDAVARGVRYWAYDFFIALRSIGYPLTIRCDTLTPSAVRRLIQRLADTVWQDLGVCPRTCPSSGAQLCTYLRWFARPACLPHKTSVLRLLLVCAGFVSSYGSVCGFLICLMVLVGARAPAQFATGVPLVLFRGGWE